MKKSTIAGMVIGLIAVGYVGSTWYMGQKIEEKIATKITEINQNIKLVANNKVSKLFEVQYDNYERGIFSSTFDLQIRSKGPVGLKEERIFNDKITVYHGPLPWNSISQGFFTPVLANLFYEINKSDNSSFEPMDKNEIIYTINALLKFGGDVDIVGKGDAFKLTPKQYDVISVSPSHFFISGDKNFKNVTLDLQLDNIKRETFNGLNVIQFKNIKLQGQNHQIEDQTSTTEAKLTVDQIAISMSNDTVKINKIDFVNNSTIANNAITGNTDIAFNSILAGVHNLGQFELNSNFELPLEKRDAPNDMLFKYDINKMQFRTEKGNLDSSITFALNGISLDDEIAFGDLNNDNVKMFRAHLSLPLEPLVYISAQVSNMHQDEIGKKEINEAKFSVNLLANLFFDRSNLVLVNEEGIFADLYFNQIEENAVINDNKVSNKQFWDILQRRR